MNLTRIKSWFRKPAQQNPKKTLVEGPRYLKIPEIIPNIGTTLQKRTVRIRMPDSLGMGLLIDNQYVLTAQHLVVDTFGFLHDMEGSSDFGCFSPFKLELIAQNKQIDLALCKIVSTLDIEELSPLRITSLEPKLGGDLDPFSKVFMLLMSRRSGPRWARVGFCLLPVMQNFAALIGSNQETSKDYNYGDSGTVALDALGRIVTVVSMKRIPDVGESVMALGAIPSEVRKFLKTHWPNYQG